MLKKTFAAVALIITAGLLAGCAPTTGKPTGTPTPTVTAADTPSLKVPEMATGNSATLMVNGGKLKKGTTATIYRFDSEWDAATVTCDDASAETREITITGDGNDQTVPFPVAPGIVSWVLVAGDFSTPCDGPGSRTTVLITTTIAVYGGAAGDKTAVGQEKTITVDGTSLPATIPVTATVNVLGPWKNLPEAQAAGCGNRAPVAASSDVKMTKDPGKVTHEYDTTFTPTKAGVYRVIVTLPKTAQSTPVDTCADKSKAVTFAVGE